MLPLKQHRVAWQSHLANGLQADLVIALCDTPVARSELNTWEQAQLASFCMARRRLHWRRGRAALKQVLAQIGLPPETGDLVFPHPRLSLSHSGDYALAVGTSAPLRGLGVDLELGRGPRSEAARLFLSSRERLAWEYVPGAQQSPLLRRLWCIKEAAFKANPHNRITALGDYELEDIHAASGQIGCRTNPDLIIDYTVDEQRIGQDLACIAVAVAR